MVYYNSIKCILTTVVFIDVKKVRNRKKRSLRLGLSRPKSKKRNTSTEASEESTDSKACESEISEMDEINASRETIDSISEIHLKRSIKKELPSVLETSTDNAEVISKSKIQDESIMDLVNKISRKKENITIDVATTYDLEHKYEPEAGPSSAALITTRSNANLNHCLNDSFDSSPEEDKGITSFYDKSKMFDLSLEDKSSNEINTSKNLDLSVVEDNNLETKSQLDFRESGMKLYYSLEDRSAIMTPKIRPPTKSYIASNLEKYKIPNVRNPEPYFSDYKDVGEKVEIGQIVIKLQSKLAQDQKAFEKVLNTTSIEEWRQLLFLQTNEMCEDSTKPDSLKTLLAGNKHCILEPIKKPPTRNEISKWIEQNKTVSIEADKVEHTEISKNIDELENSQALGLNEDEINSSISLEASDKVSLSVHLITYCNIHIFVIRYR